MTINEAAFEAVKEALLTDARLDKSYLIQANHAIGGIFLFVDRFEKRTCAKFRGGYVAVESCDVDNIVVDCADPVAFDRVVEFIFECLGVSNERLSGHV